MYYEYLVKDNLIIINSTISDDCKIKAEGKIINSTITDSELINDNKSTDGKVIIINSTLTRCIYYGGLLSVENSTLEDCKIKDCIISENNKLNMCDIDNCAIYDTEIVNNHYIKLKNISSMSMCNIDNSECIIENKVVGGLFTKCDIENSKLNLIDCDLCGCDFINADMTLKGEYREFKIFGEKR